MTQLNIPGDSSPVPPTEFVSQSTPDLKELFDRDPEQLSDTDVCHIVAEMRRMRAQFELDENAKALKPKKEKTTKAAAGPVDQLDLEDLLKGEL